MAERRAVSGAQRPCRFCAILAGTEKAFRVFEDELCTAFLDYRPLAPGHVLLVPRAHYPHLADIPDRTLSELTPRLKRIAAAVTSAMAGDGSFVALNDRVSQSVPHVHFHIVPRKKGDGLFAQRLIWKRVAYRDEAQKREIAARIKSALQA